MSDKHPILDLPMGSNDANAATIRDYRKTLLLELWKEGETFSGKCPLGNDGWQSELIRPLIIAEVLYGNIDQDGSIQNCEWDEGELIIRQAILEL